MDDNTDIRHGFLRPSGDEDNFARRMAAKLESLEEISEHKTLLSLKSSTGFIVPEGYFGEKMEFEALMGLPETLKKNSFDVPVGYFEKGTATLNGLESAASNKIVHLHPVIDRTVRGSKVRTLRQRVTWAAAALLLITLGTWLYQTDRMTPDPEDCGTLACLEKKDVLRSGEMDVLNEEELLMLVGDEDFQNQFEDKTENKDSIRKVRIQNNRKEGA